jgi:hypothetical protein
VHFITDGSTSDGEPFTLVRTNRFASLYDISTESGPEAADDLWAIESNDFTDVTINEVRISTQLNPADRAFSVGKIERKLGTGYTTLTNSSTVAARAGTTVTLRVTLNSRRNAFGTKVVMLYLKVPVAPIGTYGNLTVGRTHSPSSSPTSFDDLLTKLATAPRNDQLPGEIDAYAKGKTLTSKTTYLVRDVVQGSRSFAFRISR